MVHGPLATTIRQLGITATNINSLMKKYRTVTPGDANFWQSSSSTIHAATALFPTPGPPTMSKAVSSADSRKMSRRGLNQAQEPITRSEVILNLSERRNNGSCAGGVSQRRKSFMLTSREDCQQHRTRGSGTHWDFTRASCNSPGF